MTFSPPKSPPQSPPKSPPLSPPKSPPTSPPASPPQSGVLPECAPPDARTPPEFRVPYRHPLILKQIFPALSSPPVSISVPQFACADVPSISVNVAFDPRYEQLWTLRKFAIGDLASTLNLAPLERLVIEVKTSQRTTLERSAVESSESLESTEATLHDTETTNVARSNTTTTNWHVDGQGGFSSPYGSLNISAGYSKNVTDTSQYSQNRTNERTQKSASSLKSLHKIEIKGASESIIQDRQLRTLRNPYRDRALALNFFQLLKHFDITTSLVESRLSIAIQILDITMDPSFVLANVDFLTQHLIDDDLRAELPSAVAGARASARLSDQTPATLAQKALQFLFFNPPNIFDLPASPPIGIADANDPAASYSAQAGGPFPVSKGASAFQDVLFHVGADDNRPFAKVFFTLNFFYRLVVETPGMPPLAPGVAAPTPLDPFNNGENAIQLAVGLYNAINDDWEAALKADPQGFKNVLDNQDRTEGIRRVAGFLALVGKLVLPLIAKVTTSTVQIVPDPTKPDQTEPSTQVDVSDEETPRQANKRVLDALIAHLGCNKNYYVQRFLEYQARRTRGQALVDFATGVFSQVLAAFPALTDIQNNVVDFDPAAAFIDKQTIVIPDRLTAPILSPVVSPVGLTPDQLTQVGQLLNIFDFSEHDPLTLPLPATVQIQVPADGVHLEVAGGACILQDVPDKPLVQADLNFGPSSVSISEE